MRTACARRGIHHTQASRSSKTGNLGPLFHTHLSVGVSGAGLIGALAISWCLAPKHQPPPPPPATDATALADDYVPPFRSDSVSLSDVLQHAAAHNPDVAIADVDVEISEARVLGALGAFDVTLIAKIDGQLSEYPQRGSQLAVALGSRRFGGGLGVQRRLETGGLLSLTVDSYRARADQPANILDPTQGQARLKSFSVIPTLSLSHSLLRGAGLKVNRAPIEKARIAKTVAEADRQAVAQGVARDIILAYWDLLYAHRDLVNKRSSVELASKQYDSTLAFVRAGRRSKMDAKVAQQGLVQREAEVLASEQTLLQASVKLRGLMGDDVADADRLGLLPTTDPVVETRVVMVEDEVEQALKSNPEVRRVQLSQSSLKIDERVAANGKRPALEFEGSFTPQGRSVDRLPDPTTGQPGARSSWSGAFANIFNDDVGANGALADWTISGGVTLTWDVQNRTAKGAHQEAELALRRGQVELQAVRRKIASSVVQAASVLRTAGKMIDVAALSYELARENLRAEQTRFGVGRATNYDVLLRLDAVDRAAAEALGARVGYLKALAELQALNGELLSAYGLQ